MLTVPAVGFVRPPMIRSNEVFPQPDGPNSETNWLGATMRSIVERAVCSPARLRNCFDTPQTSIPGIRLTPLT